MSVIEEKVRSGKSLELNELLKYGENRITEQRIAANTRLANQL
jgi:hypothetical protein